MISHSYWQRRFGGNRDISWARLCQIEGQQVPIIGITPAGFGGANVGESARHHSFDRAKPVLQPENDGWVGPDAG